MGIWVGLTKPPEEQSIKSTPKFFKKLASEIESSIVQPSSRQSVAEILTKRGNPSGKMVLTSVTMVTNIVFCFQNFRHSHRFVYLRRVSKIH